MRGPWQQDVNGSEVVVCVRGVTRVSLNDHVVEIVELALLQVRRHIGGAERWRHSTVQHETMEVWNNGDMAWWNRGTMKSRYSVCSLGGRSG